MNVSNISNFSVSKSWESKSGGVAMSLSALIRKRCTGSLAAPVPATQPERETPTLAGLATLALANRKAEKSDYPVADGPFTPYCVPLSPEAVAAIRAELVTLVDKLADTEGWPDEHHVRLAQTVHRQPLSSLRDDLAHFRARWQAHEAVRLAAAVRDANRKCTTCQHRTFHESSVPVRCRHGRALGIQHHEWLDAPDTPNPCREHTPKQVVLEPAEIGPP